MDGQQEAGRVPSGMGERRAQLAVAERSQLLSPLEEKVLILAAQVFRNDLIREGIVDHAFHQGNGSLDMQTLCVLRSLGKGWNDSVCRHLHKNICDEAFEIFLGDRGFVNRKPRHEDTAELLSEFTKTFASSSKILGRTPTYTLTLGREAFHKKNSKNLYNFLQGCGEGLVSISCYIPSDGGSMKGTFPNLSLPSLQNVKLGWEDRKRNGRIRYNVNIVHLLQSIFSGATALKQVHITQFPKSSQPSHFETIALPQTLTLIDIYGCDGSEDLEILLLKNPLPILTSLTLSVSERMREGLLFRILETFRMTQPFGGGGCE